jgi:hypothetical protein
MKTTVISYSLTGNNDALAGGIASALAADHIRVTEPKPRKIGTIALDMLFNRTPKVDFSVEASAAGDRVVLSAPVWMGKIASPLRGVLKKLKGSMSSYTFVSVSGGADGGNPKLESELTKRTGKKPDAVIDMHIADLLPDNPKPSREDTSSYRLSTEDVEKMTDTVVKKLAEF